MAFFISVKSGCGIKLVSRNVGAYKTINDNYPKYVLSMDKTDFSQNGIIHKNIIDWLLDVNK